MIKRSVVYVDTMLAQLAMLCKTWRDESGKSLAEIEAPISEVVFDMLKAVGIPDNGVGLVLNVTGEEGEQPLQCAFCEQPAVAIAQGKHNPAMVCAAHATQASQHNWPILPVPTGELEL